MDDSSAPTPAPAPHQRRKRYAGRNPRRFDEKYKEHNPQRYADTVAKVLASGKPEQYPALVTDVRNFGFFVDVPGLAMSGLVHLSSVEDDFYLFDAERNQLVGRRSRRVIRLGDKVQVQVAKVDSFKKQVDFRLATSRAAGMGRPAKAPPAGRKFPPPGSSRPRREFSRRSRRR